MPEIINTAIGVTIPLLILYIGYLIERRKNKIERTHEVRIQFDLEGSVLGPQAGSYLLDLSVVLNNRGLVKHEIQDLHLRKKGVRDSFNYSRNKTHQIENQKIENQGAGVLEN